MKTIKKFNDFSVINENIDYKIDEILNNYLEAALWTEELDREYDIENFDSDSVKGAEEDIISFIRKANKYLHGIDADVIGHDFWLTRNHHGLWDRENIKKVDGDKLSEICEEFGVVSCFEQDDTIYLEKE